jgi:hypothetical protein
MADHYRVLIDLPKLAANVAAAEGRSFTAGDAYQLLIDHDFIPQPGGSWLCEEVSLGFWRIRRLSDASRLSPQTAKASRHAVVGYRPVTGYTPDH